MRSAASPRATTNDDAKNVFVDEEKASSSSSLGEEEVTRRRSKKMVVSVTGATGFVGTKLVESLLRDGHEVRVLTRSIKRAKRKLKPETLPKGTLLLIEPTKWPLGIKGSTHVVNLAG